MGVGRSIDEALRLVAAFQYVDEHGMVCPGMGSACTLRWNIFGLKIYFCDNEGVGWNIDGPFFLLIANWKPGDDAMHADSKKSKGTYLVHIQLKEKAQAPGNKSSEDESDYERHLRHGPTPTLITKWFFSVSLLPE